MNTQQAKEILSLYRPGTADAQDPSFAEALQLCEQDAQLKHWFEEHCAVYLVLRAKLKQIQVPEGLKEQILSERKIRNAPPWRRPAVLAAAAVVVALLAMTQLWLRPREKSGFPLFREQMVGNALRAYKMDLETNSLEQIRGYLAQRTAHADFVLPPGLQNARPTGCVATTWQGEPVSMICFDSGKPHPRGQTSDLWLFVADRKPLAGAPATSEPSITTVNDANTATWIEGEKVYVLVAEGDETFIRKYL
jgi:hypothetical protein